MLFLTAAIAGFAQTGQTSSVTSQAAQVTEFDVNGLKVIVKRRPSSPTVAAGLFVRGGARNINEKNAGIEGLMLRSAVEAGKKYPRQSVRRELSRTGSGIGASPGTDYSVVSLVTTKPNFARTWDIFTDVMINPAFEAADIERSRQATLSGLNESEISPEGALQAELDRVVYAGHPYSNDVNGTVTTLGAMKPADLAAYHRSIMQTSRLLLVFVGDLDPNEIKTLVANSFGKLPRGDYKEQKIAAIDFSKPTLDIVPRPNLPTNYVEGVFDAPSPSNPDFYAMQVAVEILQGLVYQEVRVNRQLSYAPAAELSKLAANTANMSVSAVDANQSVKLMLEQMRILKTQQLDEAAVAEIAGNFLTTYYLTQETSAAQVSELARYELIGGGWRNAFDFLDRVRGVKASDVNAVANKYMKNVRFVVVGKPSDIDRSVFLNN